MVGILLLAHGSRAKETEQTLNAIADMVKNMLPHQLIQTAYMEFGKINIEEGLDRLISLGARDIKVIPYFLFDGMHIKEDIPVEIARYKNSHPDITINMGKTLGADLRLAQIVKDRIEEVLA